MPEQSFSKSLRIIALALALALCVSAPVYSEALDVREDHESADAVPGSEIYDYALIDCMRTFLYDWINGYPDQMLNLVSPEWKNAQADPLASLQSIMDTRTRPRDYVLISTSGTKGDSVRKMTYALFLDQQGFSQPQYRLYEAELRKADDGDDYFVEPQSMNNPPLIAETDLLDPFNSNLDLLCPGVREHLRPVNLSSEQQGFRIEMVSALLTEHDFWFICSLEDSNSIISYRSDHPLGYTLDSHWFPRIDVSGLLSRGPSGNQSFYFVHMHDDAPFDLSDRTLTFSVQSIFIDSTRTDLAPLLKEYGKEVEGISLSDGASALVTDSSKFPPQDMKYLDFNHPLDIPLSRYVDLTGIGWIDGKLHVQFRVKNQNNHNASLVYTSDYLRFDSYDSHQLPFCPVNIGFNSPPPLLAEYVYDYPISDLDRICLHSYCLTLPFNDSDWTIQFPLSMVLADTLSPAPSTIDTQQQSGYGIHSRNFFSEMIIFLPVPKTIFFPGRVYSGVRRLDYGECTLSGVRQSG